ncbi:MAG: hypothetical protein C7B45_17110 [Sulfobacillus acidophilus]|uniref:Glycolate oxidase iron-sulfur subunit n=1 Tax=Sulfobacillus acidophilus TaxID=53633 RepID=A0A2T2WCP2_9FIRM|nr:MAG: hypothetical protein C7B45_17110 [Sulfobacillus acidophilus]
MNADQCVHCGLCLTACPTYEATGLEVESPRGRLVLLAQWAENPAERDASTATWLDDCLDCRACESVCPAHVPTGHLVEQWRAEADPADVDRRLMPWLKLLIGSPFGLNWLRKLGRWSQIPAARAFMKWTAPQFATPAVALMDGLLDYTPGPLSRHRLRSDADDGGVLLFVGCVMDAIYAETNVHTAALLRLAGQPVYVPIQQRCCGALHLHAGRRDEARQWAQRNIETYEKSKAHAIVVNAAGCGTTLKEYPQLFLHDSAWRERAVRFSEAVQDVLVVLQNHPLPDLPVRHERITIHDACHHVHAQQIFEAPRALLSRAGYQIEEMADSTRCCGSAGVYNLTHAEMSQKLLQNKLHNIPDGIETVAAANPGCMLQIQAGAVHFGRTLRVRHPVDLAYQAYQDQGYWSTGGPHGGQLA